MVLGLGHPGEGLLVLEFDGEAQRYRRARSSVPEDLGGQPSDNNVRDVALGDLDEDSHMDMAVACAEHRLFSLQLYEHAKEWQAVVPPQALRGSMSSCAFLPRGRSVPPRLLFAPYAYLGENVEHLFASFLPQGVYDLHVDTESGQLKLRGVDTSYRLSIAPRGEHGLPPWNIDNSELAVGQLTPSDLFYAVRESSRNLKDVRFQYALVRQLGGSTDRGFLLRRLDGPFFVRVVDWDGDHHDDLLLFEVLSGSLYVHGVGDMPAVEVSEAERPSVRHAEDEVRSKFDTAARLFKMEFYDLAAEAYAELLEVVRDSPWEEEAFLDHVRALAGGGRYDQCTLELLDWCNAGRDTSRRARLKLAEYSERLGQLEQAARFYREAAEPGLLDEGERDRARQRARELEPWGALPTPRALPFERAWDLPEAGGFHVSPSGELHFDDARPAVAPVWSDERWHGESFRLTFDLEVAEQAVGRNFGVGFLTAEEQLPVLDEFLFARVGSTSGQHRTVSIMRKAPGEDALTGEGADVTPGRGLPLDRRHRFVLTYDASAAILWLTVREVERDSAPGALYAALQFKSQGPPTAPLRLCLGAGEGEWEGPCAYSISNVSILRPEPAGPR